MAQSQLLFDFSAVRPTGSGWLQQSAGIHVEIHDKLQFFILSGSRPTCVTVYRVSADARKKNSNFAGTSSINLSQKKLYVIWTYVVLVVLPTSSDGFITCAKVAGKRMNGCSPSFLWKWRLALWLAIIFVALSQYCQLQPPKLLWKLNLDKNELLTRVPGQTVDNPNSLSSFFG